MATVTIKPTTLTIERLEQQLKATHNGRKQPTVKRANAKTVQDAKFATADGNKVSISSMGYKELQATLKGLGFKASGSTAVLRERLERVRTRTTTADDKPKAKAKSKPRTKKAAKPKRNWNGLSYRQAQKLVSWGKENIVGFNAPCKNTGWDNVEANCEALLNNSHFWAVLKNERTANELKELTGFTA